MRNDSGVHFSPETVTKIEEAEKVLNPLGISTNAIIDLSVKAGIASVVRKHKNETPRVPLTKLVEDAVQTFNGDDITTQGVIDRLRENDPDTEFKPESVSKFLARLAERKKLRAYKPKGAPGRTKVVYRVVRRAK